MQAVRNLLIAVAIVTASGAASRAEARMLDARRLEAPAASLQHTRLPFYTHERHLVGPLRYTLVPKVVVERRSEQVRGIVGFGGTLKVNAYTDLLRVESEWSRYEQDGVQIAQWSVQLRFGGELQVVTKEIRAYAKKGLGIVRRGIRL